jgi:type IV pilus assembly protein PilF
MKTQVIVFCLLAAGLTTACVSDSPSKNVTNEEKAITYMDMGVRYMDMGELRFAKENLEKALDTDGNNSNIHNAAAALYEKIREPENARNHYLIALRLDPENPQPQNNYGRFLCEQGEYVDGLEHLNLALNMPMNNRRWFALTNAGRCLLKQAQKPRAEAYFREALQLQPDYHPALLEMMKLSYNDAKYLSARAFLQRYQNVAQPTSDFLWYAMQIETALQHKNLAQQYKNALLNEFPTSDEAMRVKTSIDD